MTNNSRPKILNLAAALAMLSGPTAGVIPAAEAAMIRPMDRQMGGGQGANRFVVIGNDVLSFMVKEGENGEIIAQHRSHSSHASHASHASSRY